ncbi:MAG: hypothetical protein ACOC9P_02535 [bacterium]
MAMEDGDDVVVDEASPQRQAQWRDLLELHAGIRRADSREIAQRNLRATDYFHQVHGAVAFILELSMCSYFDTTLGRARPFGMEVFRALDRGLAHVLADA